MGIFPTRFTSHYSTFIGYYGESDETLAIRSKYKEQTITLRLWQEKDKLIEIDEWIGKNITNTSYYCEHWPEGEPIWIQDYIFTEIEDAAAFRLRWMEYEKLQK